MPQALLPLSSLWIAIKMNPQVPPPPNTVAWHAFTLVEMLVSMSVMILIVVMVSQLTNSATMTVTSSRKHMDADTQARLILNRMAFDISNMILRSDLDYSKFKQPAGKLPAQYSGAAVPVNTQSGNDQIAFYAREVGYFSGASTPPPSSERASLALVGYYTANDPYFYQNNRAVLQRMGKGLGWEPDPSGNFLGVAYLPVTLSVQWPHLFDVNGSQDPVDQDWKTVGDQVFRFEYTYLLKANYSDPKNPQKAKLSNTPYWDATTNKMMTVNPHTCINGFQDVAAIVVAIAILDTTSATIVNNNTTLASALPDATEGSDIQSAWETAINTPGFAKTAGIPQQAASAIRIYQRYIYLPQ